MLRSPFSRQLFVAIAPQLSAVSMGGSLGYASVLLQQLQSKESSIQPDLDTLTWITSIHGISGIGGLLIPSLLQKIGRKKSFILTCIVLIVGWLVAFSSINATMIIIAECILGFGCNCNVVVNLVTVSEMVQPKYRTFSMMLLGITQVLGMIVVTALGTIVNWKTLALVMCSPVIVSLIMALVLPESPIWLAYKGNYDKCEEVFKWLRGTDDDSIKELEILLTVKEPRRSSVLSKRSFMGKTWRNFKRKDFMLPILHMILVFSNFYFSGGICLFVYGKYIIKLATGNESISTTGYLLIDANLLVGALIAIFIIRKFNSKTVLNIASIRIIFLYCCCLVLYLQKQDLISKNPWIFVSFFEIYMIFFASGLNTLSFALAIELIPVKHKGCGGILYNIFTCLAHFMSNKLLPYLILWLDTSGAFLFFAISGTVTQILIWRYIPETKNKTLQEIEDFYNKHDNYVYNHENDCVDLNLPILVEKIK